MVKLAWLQRMVEGTGDLARPAHVPPLCVRGLSSSTLGIDKMTCVYTAGSVSAPKVSSDGALVGERVGDAVVGSCRTQCAQSSAWGESSQAGER